MLSHIICSLLYSMYTPPKSCLHKRWFTVIEIIIALIIFGIWMITLLRAIVYYIAMGDEVKMKSEAMLLAKESMDIVYNQRDTNLHRSVKRQCARIDASKPEACDYTFAPWTVFRTEFNGYSWYTIVPSTTWDIANTLYKRDNNGVSLYTHQSNNTPSLYSRYVMFDTATLGSTTLGTWDALKVSVYVLYKRGGGSRKVVLESILSAWEKSN